MSTEGTPPKNNIVYSWHNHWVNYGRYFDLREAAERTGRMAGGGVVIDLVSGRMVARNGVYCDRKRPVGIKNLPLADVWTKAETATLISTGDAARRDLHTIGTGDNEYHVTLWGDTAPKVQIGVKANNQEAAEATALKWGREEWWRDQRKIGVETVERVMTFAEEAELLNQADQRGLGTTNAI